MLSATKKERTRVLVKEWGKKRINNTHVVLYFVKEVVRSWRAFTTFPYSVSLNINITTAAPSTITTTTTTITTATTTATIILAILLIAQI